MMCRAVIVSSSGNPTCIVDHEYFDAPYSAFSELVETLGVEQSGAIRIGMGNVLHLRMMGREFSLNGLASAAIAYGQLYGDMARALNVSCHLLLGNILTANVSIGVPRASGFVPIDITFPRVYRESLVSVEDGKRQIGEVRLPGIRHVLVPMGTHVPTMAEAEQILAAVADNDSTALGIIFFRNDGKSAKIWPFVWVPKVNTFIAETSCGSGALALAILRWRTNTSEAESIEVLQPAGGVITVRRVPASVNVSEDCLVSVGTAVRTEATLEFPFSGFGLNDEPVRRLGLA
jgi:hypothetical protein